MSPDNPALAWSMAATPAFNSCCEQGLIALGIDFFHFVRVDAQGRRVMLCTRADWLAHIHTQGILQTPLALALHTEIPSGEYPWHEFDQEDPLLKETRDYLGLQAGLSIIIRQPTASYHYHFADSQGRTSLYDYHHHGLQALYRFILMFHDKAENLLQQAYLHPWESVSPPLYKASQPTAKIQVTSGLTERLHYDRWMLPWQESALQFSSREMECLACLMEGLTAKQIGRRLGISHRTVQTHWERIRMKVGTRSCHDLVAAMRGGGLANLIAQSVTNG